MQQLPSEDEGDDRRHIDRRFRDQLIMRAVQEAGFLEMSGRQLHAFPDLIESFLTVQHRRQRVRAEIAAIASAAGVIGGFLGFALDHLWPTTVVLR